MFGMYSDVYEVCICVEVQCQLQECYYKIYDVMLDVLGIGILYVASECYVVVNFSMLWFFGYSCEEFVGYMVVEFGIWVDLLQCEFYIWEFLVIGKVDVMDISVCCKDGCMICGLIFVCVLIEDGELYMLFIFYDFIECIEL